MNIDTINSSDRLDRIRRISNAVQALENLIAQCDGINEFAMFREKAILTLINARKLLTREIHG